MILLFSEVASTTVWAVSREQGVRKIISIANENNPGRAAFLKGRNLLVIDR
jgi:hypothetical protein